MRTTIISLLVLVGIVLGLALYQGQETFRMGLRASGTQTVLRIATALVLPPLAGIIARYLAPLFKLQ
ncbi:MAG: hypothetical protein QNJ45_18170 [Ardenticatenaceae bacterium]|nr:hypothetical protein [Ardenticatenaceae bacterium]